MIEKSTVRSRVSPNGIPYTTYNVVDDTDHGYYVSYNNYDYAIYGSDTTAIVLEVPRTVFLILNGDHREVLDGLNRKEAIAYFHSNKKFKNEKSDPDENYVLELPKKFM